MQHFAAYGSWGSLPTFTLRRPAGAKDSRGKRRRCGSWTCVWKGAGKMRIERGLFCRAILALIVAAAPALCGAEAARPLSLQESIDLALKQSVLIHSAEEGVRGAEALQREARTGFLPRLSTSYSYTRLNEDPYITSPGMSLPLPLPIGTVTVPPSTYQAGTKDNYTWSIEARQPLFTGGAILANYEASRLGADIARYERTAAIQDLVLEVKVAYFNILKAERLLMVARQSVTQLDAHLETARNTFAVGMIPRNDVLQAEVQQANGRQLLVRAENAVEMAHARFNTILRREINAAVEIEDSPGEPLPAPPLDACIAAALENRPEILSAALRVEQARRGVTLAKSEYYPSVSVLGNYSRYGDTPGVSGNPYKDRESWYVLALANWNFWEWGKTKNRVEAGVSRENQAADLAVHIRDQITLEVKNALLLAGEAEKQLPVTKKAIEQAEENFRINTERYREQVGTATEVIDAQTLLTKTRSDHFNAWGDFRISGARLDRAMGSGSRDGK
jgi:outer membrane protein